MSPFQATHKRPNQRHQGCVPRVSTSSEKAISFTGLGYVLQVGDRHPVSETKNAYAEHSMESTTPYTMPPQQVGTTQAVYRAQLAATTQDPLLRTHPSNPPPYLNGLAKGPARDPEK